MSEYDAESPPEGFAELIGLVWRDIGRAASMAFLGFGDEVSVTNHLEKQRAVNEFSLHIQFPWRLASSTETLVASNDMY
ncbi:hypothetical protein Ssi02_63080 [Sinosporangium siamense]|uniref:Uncharacterized protein n=1 Tax=Sinosporangium siamense TaxID=1367973 RepID=A0A919VB35_9ACTN|nr:hypothetical protein Ssi02_63080 [Sinosporangium siamense]